MARVVWKPTLRFPATSRAGKRVGLVRRLPFEVAAFLEEDARRLRGCLGEGPAVYRGSWDDAGGVVPLFAPLQVTSWRCADAEVFCKRHGDLNLRDAEDGSASPSHMPFYLAGLAKLQSGLAEEAASEVDATIQQSRSRFYSSLYADSLPQV